MGEVSSISLKNSMQITDKDEKEIVANHDRLCSEITRKQWESAPRSLSIIMKIHR